jgi:2-keto-4-pentenoate hydratase/2-oxohepta-3-ene-1,7-dioic acid hydratase in catechol pathway
VRIVVFGPDRRVGAWEDDRIVDLHRAESRIPADLAGFIAGGAAVLERARAAIAGGPTVDRSEVTCHAPAVYRPRIACAGGNYALHAAGAQSARTGQPADVDEIYRQSRSTGPWGFWKVVDPLVADGGDVVYPRRATHFDYEGEVAIVIGVAARDVPAERAHQLVWGVTLLNDWSVRNDMGPPRPLNFNLAKNFDTSVSLGPSIVVGELDPQDVDLELRVNGALRQAFNSRDMTFTFSEFIAHLSRDFTFQPGDIIAGGTGAGTAMDTTRPAADGSTPTDLFLNVGDTVEVSSPRIGTLRNRIVARA